MSRYLQQPNLARQIGHTKARTESLERELSRRQQPVPAFRMVFNLPGAVFVSESGYDTHPYGGRLIYITARLRVSGSTDTVFQFKKNGISIDTLTVTSGSTYAYRAYDNLFTAGFDTASIAVTTAGTDAEDLVVVGQFDQ